MNEKMRLESSLMDVALIVKKWLMGVLATLTLLDVAAALL